MSKANTVIAVQDETISHICWRLYGDSVGMVEKVMAVNPNLCDLPPNLPAGTIITLPKQSSHKSKTNNVIQTVNLWE